MYHTASAISNQTRNELDAICAKSSIMLLGVTGGIASGKSTVADMLREMGAPVIDFDILARQVVEPGRPAWEAIIDYFGKELLQDNNRLDRKKLSKIVFRDTEKRKKLEAFTHPRINDEFVKQVDEITHKDPAAIIQGVVPLLIEVGLQDLFHKVLVVYLPREKQIERLMERDRISREETINILNAQMPIDEKILFADFVIHNESPLKETKRQARDLWQTLKKLQEENRAKAGA